jgi:hypothetical protein
MITFIEYLQSIEEAPLTPKQRMQRSRLMKRLAPRMAMKRKITMKRKANPEKIKARAEKQARDIIRKKLLKDVDYNTLGYAQKVALDKRVEKKKAAIKKIAKKLTPKVKKDELERLKKQKEKGQSGSA